MKTIYTTLPVYDKLTKQYYYRSGDNKKGLRGPVQTPRHRLPSMQWNVGTTNPGAISTVQIIGAENGDAYNNTPFTFKAWYNLSYDVFVSSGLDIISAVNLGSGADGAGIGSTTGQHTEYAGKLGETICIKGDYRVISGDIHTDIEVYGIAAGYLTLFNLTQGTNTITYTFPADDLYYFKYTTPFIGVTQSHTSFTNVTIEVDMINQFFVTLPTLFTTTANDYYQYKGDTLNYLLTPGVYYLKMTSANGYVYYSEIFEVTCIYPNLITSLSNNGYETLTTYGTQILSAINSAGSGIAQSDVFPVIKGETITIIFYYVAHSGTIPALHLANVGWSVSVTSAISAGLNVINLTSTWDGNAYILLYNNASNTSFYTSDILVIRQYSEDYLRIDFHNNCDLGELLYQDNFTQSLWIKGDNIETTFPMTPEGSEDGNGKFIPTFRRQEKLYLIKTGLVSLALIDCLYRLMLHDTVTMIDLVGDSWTIENIEVEHAWQPEDNYYALATLTVDLGEAVVIAGCCNNQT